MITYIHLFISIAFVFGIIILILALFGKNIINKIFTFLKEKGDDDE